MTIQLMNQVEATIHIVFVADAGGAPRLLGSTVEAIVVRRKVVVHSGRIALMLLEAKIEQHALALLRKRLAIVAQNHSTLRNTMVLKKSAQQLRTLRNILSCFVFLPADVDDALRCDAVFLEALVEVLNLGDSALGRFAVAAKGSVVSEELAGVLLTPSAQTHVMIQFV